MKPTSSAAVLGYTVVTAPPAHMTAKSASTHSTRVEHAMATRSSDCSPSASSPAASRVTRSPVAAQLRCAQPVPVG